MGKNGGPCRWGALPQPPDRIVPQAAPCGPCWQDMTSPPADGSPFVPSPGTDLIGSVQRHSNGKTQRGNQKLRTEIEKPERKKWGLACAWVGAADRWKGWGHAVCMATAWGSGGGEAKQVGNVAQYCPLVSSHDSIR